MRGEREQRISSAGTEDKKRVTRTCEQAAPVRGHGALTPKLAGTRSMAQAVTSCREVLELFLQPAGAGTLGFGGSHGHWSDAGVGARAWRRDTLSSSGTAELGHCREGALGPAGGFTLGRLEAAQDAPSCDQVFSTDNGTLFNLSSFLCRRNKSCMEMLPRSAE